MMILGKDRINKGREMKRLSHNVMFHPGMFLEGLRETTKNPITIDGVKPEI